MPIFSKNNNPFSLTRVPFPQKLLKFFGCVVSAFGSIFDSPCMNFMVTALTMMSKSLSCFGKWWLPTQSALQNCVFWI